LEGTVTSAVKLPLAGTMGLPAATACVASRSSCSCTSRHWVYPPPVTLIVVPGVPELRDSARVTTSTLVEARPLPG
jgi:hypothetical protein